MIEHDAMAAAPRGLLSGTNSFAAQSGSPFAFVRRRCGGFGTVFWAVLAALAAATGLAFGGPLPSNIYAIDDNNVLWFMDPVTQTSGTLFQTALTGPSNGYAYDTAREELFVVDGANDLYWWKQGETSFSLVATGSQFGIPANDLQQQPWGAAYYDNAYWFFQGNALLGTNVLEKVSLSYPVLGQKPTVSGFTTYTVPEINVNVAANAFGDIAIAVSGSNQGKLYAYTTSTPGRFYSLNLNTIASGTSGYNLINTTSGTSLQLAFSPDFAVLYGQNFADGTWYTVDTSTGALSQIGTFTTTPLNGQGFRDLGGSSIQAVPEPDTLVLAAMGGGVLAWQVSRRRNRRDGGPDESSDSPDDVPHPDADDRC